MMMDRLSTSGKLAVYGAAAATIWVTAKSIRKGLSWLFPAHLPGEPNTILLATPVIPGAENQIESAKDYDYIVCGGGTTGVVLAARLSEDPAVSVLLVESGFSDLKQIFSRIPAGLTKLFHGPADWDINTTKGENMNGRSLYWPRFKGLGGCSSLNALMVQRPAPDDLDEWERLGAKGWNFKNMLQWFKKCEGFYVNDRYLTIKDHSEHGTTGPMKVSYAALTELGNNFIKACQSIGIPAVDDINTAKGCRGVTRTQTSITEKGERCSTALAYLTADVVSRPNLKIAVGQSIKRIVFDQSGKRPKAVGVEMSASSIAPVSYLAHARREVIVCGGAVHSPQILMCSGVGPAEHLKKFDIPVVVDLPGVGQDLQDHLVVQAVAKIPASSSLQQLTRDIPSIPYIIKWLRSGTGPFAGNVCDTFAFVSAKEMGAPDTVDDELSGPNSADLEFVSAPVCLAAHAIVQPPTNSGYMSIGAVGLRPQSKGQVTLASASVFDPPIVDANYLATESDRALMVHGYKLCRKMAHSAAYEGIFQGWHIPERFDYLNDDEILDAVKDNGETLYHPLSVSKIQKKTNDLQVSTCKIGEKPTNGAVVDSSLRVFGVDGLRVADASVFAKQIAGHPQLLCMAIGEKLADELRKK